MAGPAGEAMASLLSSAASSKKRHWRQGLKALHVVVALEGVEPEGNLVLQACSNFSASQTKHAALPQQLQEAALRHQLQVRLEARWAVGGALPRMPRGE